MLIEIKLTKTTYIEVETKAEMMTKLRLDDKAIADNIWKAKTDDNCLSEESEIFLEESIEKHRVDVSNEIEITFDSDTVLLGCPS